MANTGFGADFPNTEARQYPLAAVYQLGVNPADATVAPVIKLPPGAQITGGLFNVTTAGTASAVHDNAATPLSLFGAVAGTVGNTPLALFPSYPSGATLSIAPGTAVGNVVIEYVIVGRQNESYLV